MKIVCWQMILMKYHTYFFRKLGKVSQNLSSAAVVIGALRLAQSVCQTILIQTRTDVLSVMIGGPNCLQRSSADNKILQLAGKEFNKK